MTRRNRSGWMYVAILPACVLLLQVLVAQADKPGNAIKLPTASTDGGGVAGVGLHGSPTVVVTQFPVTLYCDGVECLLVVGSWGWPLLMSQPIIGNRVVVSSVAFRRTPAFEQNEACAGCMECLDAFSLLPWHPPVQFTVYPSEPRRMADLDGDGDVDLADVANMQLQFTGPGGD